MNFNRPGKSDDLLFVIALLLPAVFAGARYFESDRQMNQIAQARSRGAVAVDSNARSQLRLAHDENRAAELRRNDYRPRSQP
jgi:hypothetical protein